MNRLSHTWQNLLRQNASSLEQKCLQSAAAVVPLCWPAPLWGLVYKAGWFHRRDGRKKDSCGYIPHSRRDSFPTLETGVKQEIPKSTSSSRAHTWPSHWQALRKPQQSPNAKGFYPEASPCLCQGSVQSNKEEWARIKIKKIKQKECLQHDSLGSSTRKTRPH